MTVDQDGEVACHRGLGRQDRRRRRRPLRRAGRVARGRAGGRGGIDEAGVVGVVGDHEHVGPFPRFDGGPSCPPEVQRRFAKHRDHVARAGSEEPGPLVVVADGEGEGDVGVAEIDRRSRGRRGPRARRGRRHGRGTVRGGPSSGVARWNVTPVGPTWTRRTVGPGRPLSSTAQPEQPVGRLERLQRRHAVETLEQGGGVDRTLRE